MLFYFMVLYWGQNTWVPVISQVKKKFWSIVANCLKISNHFSEARFDDAEFTSILWCEKCT
jgi:hypothetical protein